MQRYLPHPLQIGDETAESCLKPKKEAYFLKSIVAVQHFDIRQSQLEGIPRAVRGMATILKSL